MTFSILLGDEDLVLHVEMRDVILQVHILRDDKGSDNLIEDFCNEGIVCRCWVDSTVIESLVNGLRVIEACGELFGCFEVFLDNSLDIHVLLE